MDAEANFKDRIGEDTDPSNCALCHAVSCFSCVQGYCTALEKVTVGGCVFYKDAAQNRKEIRKCFYRLIILERFDLLRKYADTMAALGLMDEELADAELQRKRLVEYRSRHFASLFESHWKDTLTVVYPVDEEDDGQDDTSDVEPQEFDLEPEYDNSVEQAVFPEGIAEITLDDETAEDIETRDSVLQEEVKPENYHMYDVLHDANVRAVTDSGEDELPEDYSEDDEDEIDEDNPVDKDGNPITYDSLGLTVFKTQRIAVTDEETGEQTIIRFPRGSVIIDADTMWDRGFGSFNFTLAHEMYHWYAHRVHMAFIDIMGRPDDYDAVKGHLESQADGVGARILMPRDTVIAKYRQAVDQFGSGDDVDTYELAVTECAAFFGASKTAMKKRLHELGLHKETRRPAVRRRLDIVEMFTQYATDKGFRDLLDSGAYRYIRGFVVRNDPKYINEDGLTLYAKEHLTECTMTFREQFITRGDDQENLLFRKDAYFSRTADYDRRMAESPELMKKLAEKLAKLKELYIGSLESQESFCQFIMPIITDLNTKYMGLDIQDEVDDGFEEGKLVLNPDKRYRSRYFLHYDFQTGKTIRITEPEVFQDKTLVGYKMFEKMRRNDWNNPDLDMVMAVCAGYHLDIETTEKALLRAGYLLTQHNPRHLVFRFLTAHCRGEHTDTG